MRIGILVVALLGLLMPDGAADRYRADVFEIKFVSPFGNRVGFKVAEFRQVQGLGKLGPDRSQEFRDGKIRHLELGSYRYRLVPENQVTLPAEGTVEIGVDKPTFGAHSLLVVEAKLNEGYVQADPAEVLVDGVVTGLSANSADKAWITVLDPYGGEALWEATLDEAGHFAFGDIKIKGNFILAVFQDGRVLASQPTQIDAEHFGHTGEIRVNIHVGEPAASSTRTPLLKLALEAATFVALLIGGLLWWGRKRRQRSA